MFSAQYIHFSNMHNINMKRFDLLVNFLRKTFLEKIALCQVFFLLF